MDDARPSAVAFPWIPCLRSSIWCEKVSGEELVRAVNLWQKGSPGPVELLVVCLIGRWLLDWLINWLIEWADDLFLEPPDFFLALPFYRDSSFQRQKYRTRCPTESVGRGNCARYGFTTEVVQSATPYFCLSLSFPCVSFQDESKSSLFCYRNQA